MDTQFVNQFVYQKNNLKILKSDLYNYIFNFDNGNLFRWGKTYEENPLYCPYGPEILDIEIAEVCHGGCTFCYKSNVSYVGRNMTYDTFKRIFKKLPHTITQIAFGIGDIDGNPDLFKIMDYCKNNDYNKVIPNITINGKRMTPHYYDQLLKYCGAVAVSNYGSDSYYNAVYELATIREMKQINIHQLVCEETYDNCIQLINDVKYDKRLRDLNAIVFLTLKPKGKRNEFHKINSIEKYKTIIDLAIENNINFGTDSCGAPSLLYSLKDKKNFQDLQKSIESCESTLSSLYINVEGDVYPCSFTEDEPGYKKLNILDCDDFIRDIWYDKDIINFRRYSLNQHNKHICNDCRFCPAKFDIYDNKIKNNL